MKLENTNKHTFDQSDIRKLSTKYFGFPYTGSNKGNKGEFALTSTPLFMTHMPRDDKTIEIF